MPEAELIQLQEHSEYQQHRAPGAAARVEHFYDSRKDQNQRPELEEMPGVDDAHVVEEKNRADGQNHRARNQPAVAMTAVAIAAAVTAFPDSAVHARLDSLAQVPTEFFSAVHHFLNSLTANFSDSLEANFIDS